MHYLIIGFGLTGRAILKHLVVNHLIAQNNKPDSIQSDNKLFISIYDAKVFDSESILQDLKKELELSFRVNSKNDSKTKTAVYSDLDNINIKTVTNFLELEKNNIYKNIDLAIASPGVNPSQYHDVLAQKFNIKIISDIQLFVNNFCLESVAPTGDYASLLLPTHRSLGAVSRPNFDVSRFRGQAPKKVQAAERSGRDMKRKCPWVQHALEKENTHKQYCNKNIYTITGTNGKSTACALLYHLLEKNKHLNNIDEIALAGNYGTPAIDLITDHAINIISSDNLALEQNNLSDTILELSSYQLALTDTLPSLAALCLNISPDHLDWHQGFENYLESKLRIYHDSEYDIFDLDNKNILNYYIDNILTAKSSGQQVPKIIYYTTQIPYKNALKNIDDKYVKGILSLENNIVHDDLFVFFNGKPVISVDKLPLSLKSNHNIKNLLAALSMLTAKFYQIYYENHLSESQDELTCEQVISYLQQNLENVKSFSPLPFRCELISSINNIKVYNDSKATNLNAVVTAVNSIASDLKLNTYNGKIILILGGLVKEDISDKQSRNDFINCILSNYEYIKSVFICTKDDKSRQEFINLINEYNQHSENSQNRIESVLFIDLLDTLQSAYQLAKPNDVILFSPGGASFDSFNNYIERGEHFTNLVSEFNY